MEKMGTRDTGRIGAALVAMVEGTGGGFDTHGALSATLEGATASGRWRVGLADEVAGGDNYEARRAFADAIDSALLVRGRVLSYGAPVAVLVGKDMGPAAWFIFHGYRGSMTTSRHRNEIRRALAARGVEAPDFSAENIARVLLGLDIDKEGAVVAGRLSETMDPFEALEVAAGVLV